MQVHVTAGNIIEENHYYAYGLRIAALSSRKLGNSYEGELKNNYLYQGAYAELDEDIGWNDFALRNYDAQIGRWVQQDPYQEFASPYVGMGNDPVNLVDPSGGSILSGLSKAGTVAVFTIGGAIIGTAVDLISGGDGFKGTAIGAGIGLAAGFGFLIEKITINMGIATANAAINIINGSVTSNQVGNSLDGTNSIGHGPNNNVIVENNIERPEDDDKSYWPIYNNPDAAAAGFSMWVSQNQGGAKPREYSSLIYQIEGKYRRKYYSYTIPMKYDSEYGEHHAPPPEKLNELNLLPKGASENGYIHSHTFANAPDGNLPSPADGRIIGRYNGGPIYFLNSSGVLQRWGRNSREFIPIVRGYKNGPVRPVEGDFDFGESLDMSEVNYYDIFK